MEEIGARDERPDVLVDAAVIEVETEKLFFDGEIDCDLNGDGLKQEKIRYTFSRLNRLASETAGTYLVGKSNFWHGGIHITDKIAPHCVKNDMVRCMADGTVVAYRINADYLQSACMGESLKYSTGFVLVRHDYKSAENSEEGPNKGKRNELTFYSLYMHVAPFSEYGGGTAKPVYKITADNLRARTEASLSGAEIGFLKTGAEIEVQETREVVNGNQKYLFAHATLKSGAIHNGNAAVDQGKNPFWVAIEQTAPAAKKFAVAQAQKVPELPFYLQGKCIAKTKGEINARINDSGTEDSIHGKLPAGTELTFDRSHEKTISINRTRYRFAPCTIQRCSAPDWESWPSPLWVSVEARFVDITCMRPDHLDEVVACNISVKAGAKLARMGLYESTESLMGGKNSKHLVHVEMFSFDPGLESFLKNSAGLTQGGKFLRLEKGHKLHKKTGSAEAVEFVEGDRALSRVAVVPLSGLKKYKDKAGKQWLEVDISDKTGHLKGFVEEESANLVSQHDWMNLGFQTVRAPEAFDGHLARTGIHPFYKELYQKIADEPAPEDRDKIRAALISKDNCAVWSKIIARHPSEWKHPSGHGTWSVLDKLLKSVPEVLDHEKERIDKCVWWDDVAEKVPGFDQSGVVWHFHPVGVVSVQGAASGRWKLGTTSEQFETGGRGVATISTGSGDFGGVSYGSYQLSSSLGAVQKFIAQSSYKQEFATLEVNSDKFKKKWKEIAEREPEEFEASQHQFIKATHYDVQMKFLAGNGLVVDHKRASIHDMIWSTSVQFGPETKLITKALAGRDFSLLSEEQVVKMVQQYKHDKTETYFASSPRLWAGLKQRALQEKEALLKLVMAAEEIE